MDDKELNKLAEKIANIIVSRLEDQQKKWDKEFYESNPEMYFIPEIIEKPKKEILNEELNVLEKLLEKYTEDENYLKAAEINNRIIKLKKQIKEL